MRLADMTDAQLARRRAARAKYWELGDTRTKILRFCREYLISTQHRMGASCNEIAEAVGISAPAVSYQLRQLEKHGYVRRDAKMRGYRRVRLPGEPLL